MPTNDEVTKSLEELESVRVLRLEPGDFLVLAFPPEVPEKHAREIAQTVGKHVSERLGFIVDVIILPASMTLEVLRKEGE